jgi:hypothetical protein
VPERRAERPSCYTLTVPPPPGTLDDLSNKQDLKKQMVEVKLYIRGAAASTTPKLREINREESHLLKSLLHNEFRG